MGWEHRKKFAPMRGPQSRWPQAACAASRRMQNLRPKPSNLRQSIGRWAKYEHIWRPVYSILLCLLKSMPWKYAFIQRRNNSSNVGESSMVSSGARTYNASPEAKPLVRVLYPLKPTTFYRLEVKSERKKYSYWILQTMFFNAFNWLCELNKTYEFENR